MENIIKATKKSIYRFVNGQDTEKYILAISDDYRCMDKIISILMLGDSPIGRDVVQIDGNFGSKFVHCEMVTYCKRDQIGEKVGEISDELMEKIEDKIIRGLGILKTVRAEKTFYEIAYNNLLNKVVSNQG